MDRLTNFILADAVETGTTATATATARGGNGDHGGSRGEMGGDEQQDDDSETRIEGQTGAQQRHLGVVMIPGKHLVRVERLGGGDRPDEREEDERDEGSDCS